MAATTAVPPQPAAVHTQPAVTAVVGATPPPSPHVAMSGGVGVGQTHYSLYVGDLDTSVDEGQLYDVFNQVAQVVSVRVCRDQSRTRASLGYAYVNFTSPQDAATARELLNFTQVNGKPMRIMFSHRDPSLRKSGYANVFIKNLDSSIDNKALQDTFAAFGTVLSCKVAVDSNGLSKGYGFVQFDQDKAAQDAINRLNGMLINDKQVYVGHFIRRQERSRTNASDKFTNIYVKNLPETTSDEDLKKLFEKYGTITSALVMKDTNGKTRCFGFVNFETSESAASAVEQLNGSSLNEKVLFVAKAQKKSEREADLRAKFEQERASRFEKLKGANLYLKNLDDSVNDENLKELFAEYGTITSCKVMHDAKGVSKGSGFVAFSTPEEATRALNEMNGKLIGKKPLFVAVAQRKDERRVWLQAHFARMRPVGGMAPPPGGMPGFHNGAPRLAPQQAYFGQGAPGFIAPQAAGFGFQQQLMPGFRPGVGLNFLLPYQLQHQGQHGRVGGRRGGNSQPQQQQWNSGRFNLNGRNGMHPSIPQGMVGPIMSAPFDAASGMTTPPLDIQRSNPVPPSTLASSLAFASPEDQHMMLGEQLFPLVECIERDHAGKVTGMLLEMDQTEVLHLIESPDALKKKVSEAMAVLRLVPPGSSVGDKFGSLTLNG
ncbi:polyadenylate-binding protein 5 isoform X1 [Lycium ferocissimum]|uniref:polyadenylate-binding protein 5 isoform X1 n=1 Tax=Lycium ferocissimum TaxID=112874 RepID=UPI002815C3DC|nr:polyadenylate-binding protein 5 isoform X1 [Lycium ferocissimum]